MDRRWLQLVIVQYQTLAHTKLGLVSASYTSVFRLHADISHLPRIPQVNPLGEIYYNTDVSVILLFGLTELQAQLSWIENVSIFLWFTVLKLNSASLDRVLSVGKNAKYYRAWRSRLTLQCLCRSPAKLIFEAAWRHYSYGHIFSQYCSRTPPNICQNMASAVHGRNAHNV